MRMRFIIAILWACVLLPSRLASAEESPTAAITSVQVWLASVDVFLKDVTYECGGVSNRKYKLSTSTANYQAIYTALMAAYLSEKPVQLRYDCRSDNVAEVTGARLF